MLKIKYNVDLKELEKFGFKDLNFCYKKYIDFGGILFINSEKRIITRIHLYSLREIPTNEEIGDLIQAGLVEKVEE